MYLTLLSSIKLNYEFYLMNIIRYIAFVPICFFSFFLIYFSLSHLILWFLGLDTFWLIVILLGFGSLIWGVFKGFAAIIMAIASFVSPNRQFSALTILILSLLNCVWLIYNIWSMDVNYSGKVIFAAIVFTILTFELTFAIIYGAAIGNGES